MMLSVKILRVLAGDHPWRSGMPSQAFQAAAWVTAPVGRGFDPWEAQTKTGKVVKARGHHLLQGRTVISDTPSFLFTGLMSISGSLQPSHVGTWESGLIWTSHPEFGKRELNDFEWLWNGRWLMMMGTWNPEQFPIPTMAGNTLPSLNSLWWQSPRRHCQWFGRKTDSDKLGQKCSDEEAWNPTLYSISTSHVLKANWALWVRQTQGKMLDQEQVRRHWPGIKRRVPGGEYWASEPLFCLRNWDEEKGEEFRNFDQNVGSRAELNFVHKRQ